MHRRLTAVDDWRRLLASTTCGRLLLNANPCWLNRQFANCVAGARLSNHLFRYTVLPFFLEWRTCKVFKVSIEAYER